VGERVSPCALAYVQTEQHDLAGALVSHQNAYAIADRLAKSDPANSKWQDTLAVSFEKVGEAQRDQEIGLRQPVPNSEACLIGNQRRNRITLCILHVADLVIGKCQIALPAGIVGI
jgi:hypothetical protein